MFTRVSSSGARVLVVEDSLANQKLAVRMLEKLGYSVDVVGNGAEAVEIIQRVEYQAVLMDCNMPRMDGFEATAQIRKLEGSARHTPIIALTAAALMGDRERCLRSGMDDYLTKPIMMETLRNALERWIPTDAHGENEARVPGDGRAEVEGEKTMPTASVPEWIREPDDASPDPTLARLLLRDADMHVHQIKEAVRRRDDTAVTVSAHKLAGTAAYLAARTVVSLCTELQRFGSGHDIGGVAHLVERLEAELARVQRAVDNDSA